MDDRGGVGSQAPRSGESEATASSKGAGTTEADFARADQGAGHPGDSVCRAEADDEPTWSRGAEGQWGSAPHGTDGTPDTRGPSAGDHREGVGGGGG